MKYNVLISYLLITLNCYSQNKTSFKKYKLGESITKYKTEFTHSGINELGLDYYKYSAADPDIKSIFGVQLKDVVLMVNPKNNIIEHIGLIREISNDFSKITEFELKKYHEDLMTIIQGLSHYYGELIDKRKSENDINYRWANEECTVSLIKKQLPDKIIQIIITLSAANNKKIIDDF